MSAPEDPPPAQVLEPALVDDRDQTSLDHEDIYRPMLGPTLAQLQEKADKGKLNGDDIAGYLALVQAFSETCGVVPDEYRGTRPQQIAGEVLPLIAAKLVDLRVWSQMENNARMDAARKRNKKLCDIANERFPDPKIDAITVAGDLLKDPDRTLYELLQVWKPEQNAWGLMEERTLRGILAERHKHHK